MKKLILPIFLGLFISTSALADENCYLVKEGDKTILEEGNCNISYSPCSTFKLALSLMGYNEGILIDENHPEVPFKEGYDDRLEVWKQPHTPQSFMKNSVVWYSQYIVREMGEDKFHTYIKKFTYGNQVITKLKGFEDKHLWISNALEITPQGQIDFLTKLANNKLPVNPKSHEMTKNIAYLETFPNGWKLYGKTGTGNQFTPDRTAQTELKHGWFVGWVEKGDRKMIFASHRTDDKKYDRPASFRIKEDMIEKMKQITKNIDNEKTFVSPIGDNTNVEVYSFITDLLLKSPKIKETERKDLYKTALEMLNQPDLKPHIADISEGEIAALLRGFCDLYKGCAEITLYQAQGVGIASNGIDSKLHLDKDRNQDFQIGILSQQTIEKLGDFHYKTSENLAYTEHLRAIYLSHKYRTGYLAKEPASKNDRLIGYISFLVRDSK